MRASAGPSEKSLAAHVEATNASARTNIAITDRTRPTAIGAAAGAKGNLAATMKKFDVIRRDKS